MLGCLALNAKSLPAGNEALFKKSNEYLFNANYKEAIDGYLKLENAGVKSTGLYTNLGGAYYKTHQLGKAVLYFQKGLVIAPLDSELIYNRYLVTGKLDKSVINNNLAFDSKQEKIYRLYDSLNVIATVIMMVCCILFLTFLILSANPSEFKIRGVPRYAFTISILLVVVLMILVKVYQTSSYGVVIQSDTVENLGPSSTSKVVDNLFEGYEAEIINKYGNYFEIRDYQGKTGWVSKDNFCEVK